MRVRQVVWTFFVALGCALSAGQPTAALAGEAPNIVVVMSDDQTYDTVEEMPYVSSLQGLEPLGVLYDNISMCCPARAAFLSGLYAHHNGVELNSLGAKMDDRETIATWLDDGGYETGLFGKYLNGYPFKRENGEIPPGWDRWAAFATKPSYYKYDLALDGKRKSYGRDPSEYSTDVLAGKAESFVKSAEQPFFALVTPFGPHGRAIPARRHKGLYNDIDYPFRPNFSEAADDAPYYYRRLPEPSLGFHEKDWRERMEALRSVDELTEQVVSAADERSRETIVVYMSDNGYSQGSHDWPKKRCGYEECGRVPGLIRAPGDPTGLLASIVDLAPTLTDLAGVDRETTDGRSLVPYFNGQPEEADRAVLLQNREAGLGGPFGETLPGFWGVRTPRWKYLDHNLSAARPGATKRPEELYDLQADPFELNNLAGNRSFSDVLRMLRARLVELQTRPAQE